MTYNLSSLVLTPGEPTPYVCMYVSMVCGMYMGMYWVRRESTQVHREGGTVSSKGNGKCSVCNYDGTSSCVLIMISAQGSAKRLPRRDGEAMFTTQDFLNLLLLNIVYYRKKALADGWISYFNPASIRHLLISIRRSKAQYFNYRICAQCTSSERWVFNFGTLGF